jgi:hypothetical protein
MVKPVKTALVKMALIDEKGRLGCKNVYFCILIGFSEFGATLLE